MLKFKGSGTKVPSHTSPTLHQLRQLQERAFLLAFLVMGSILLTSCGAALKGSVELKASALASNGPAVASIYFPSGSPEGGTHVTVRGFGFLTGAKVFLGESACTNQTVVSNNEITCTTTAHVPGVVDTIVVNWDDQKAILEKSYTYRKGPLIEGTDPTFGSSRGGTLITIKGRFFLAGAKVTLGNSKCSHVKVESSREITCITELHASDTVDIKVVNVDDQSGTMVGGFSYRAEPNTGRVYAAASFQKKDYNGHELHTVSGADFMTGKSVMHLFFQEWLINDNGSDEE